jgi:hypothetical protein
MIGGSKKAATGLRLAFWSDLSYLPLVAWE